VSAALNASRRMHGPLDIEFHTNVRPRYTPGSPALVSMIQGEEVVADERRAYEHALDGHYGEEAQQRAMNLGLARIAFVKVRERCRAQQRTIITYRDLITGETFDNYPEPQS
jgi:hypothetical protein